MLQSTEIAPTCKNVVVNSICINVQIINKFSKITCYT